MTRPEGLSDRLLPNGPRATRMSPSLKGLVLRQAFSMGERRMARWDYAPKANDASRSAF